MVTRGLAVDDLSPLPLDAAHWQAMFAEMDLSPRQAEIAALLVRGAPFKQIAIRLKIATATIRTQQDRIFSKAGVRNREEFLLQLLALSHRVGRCGCPPQ